MADVRAYIAYCNNSRCLHTTLGGWVPIEFKQCARRVSGRAGPQHNPYYTVIPFATHNTEFSEQFSTAGLPAIGQPLTRHSVSGRIDIGYDHQSLIAAS